MKLTKGIVSQANDNIEYIIGKIDIQLEELQLVINKMTYDNEDYEIIKQVSDNKIHIENI